MRSHHQLTASPEWSKITLVEKPSESLFSAGGALLENDPLQSS